MSYEFNPEQWVKGVIRDAVVGNRKLRRADIHYLEGVEASLDDPQRDGLPGMYTAAGELAIDIAERAHALGYHAAGGSIGVDAETGLPVELDAETGLARRTPIDAP